MKGTTEGGEAAALVAVVYLQICAGVFMGSQPMCPASTNCLHQSPCTAGPAVYGHPAHGLAQGGHPGHQVSEGG